MEQRTWQDFGDLLRRTRTRRGISQEKLAEQLCCDRVYVWRLEKGARHPSRRFLRLLALSLGPFTLAEQEAFAAFEQMAARHWDSEDTRGGDFY